MSETRIVEIGGVKVEVDLRTAKVVETYRVGDNVAVLAKGWGDDFKVHPGVIAAFDEFPGLPTITIAYLEGGKLLRAHLNAKSGDKILISPLTALTSYFQREDVLGQFDREILATQAKLDELHQQRAFFVEHFGRMFGEFLEQQEEVA